MMAVGVKVHQIIQQVHARRAQAERNEGQRGVQREPQLDEPVRREQRHKNDQVLHPLMGPQRLNQSGQGRVR